MNKNLEDLQQVMQEKGVVLEKPAVIRTVCIGCNRRVARINDVFCSRCSTKTLIQKNRDVIEENVVEAKPAGYMPPPSTPPPNMPPGYMPPPASPPPDALQVLSGVEQFSRRDVAKLIGVSPTSISRWEAKGLIPAAKRFAFSNQCLYTREQVEQIRAFKEQQYVVRDAGKPAERIERVKLNPRLRAGSASKSLEKLVARQMSGMGGRSGLI